MDFLQAAALAEWFVENDRAEELDAALRDAMSRGAGWRSRVTQGRKALFRLAPEVGESLR